MPDNVTQAHGRELQKLSLLGPFFDLSVYAEDTVSNLSSLYKFLR